MAGEFQSGRGASAGDRAEMNRAMAADVAGREARRLADAERSRLSEIEYRRRWEGRWAALGMDDIIEIPCIENGERVMRRFHEKSGNLTLVAAEETDENI